MSLEYITCAFKTSFDGTAKLVLLALCNFADASGYCYPKISSIVEYSSTSRTTVIDKINFLIEKKVVKKRSQFWQNGSQTSNHYSIDLDVMKSFFCEKKNVDYKKTSNENTDKRDYCDNNKSINRGVSLTLGESESWTGVREPDVGSTGAEHHNNSHNKSNNIKEKNKQKEKISQWQKNEEFMKLWKVYPKKCDPAAAEKTYAALNLESSDMLVDAVLAQIRERELKIAAGHTFIPEWKGLQRWLNCESWHNEIMSEDDIQRSLPNSAKYSEEAAIAESLRLINLSFVGKERKHVSR